ncbi:MAG: VOC family protein [Solirubrobacterales bacterium]|jgi:predicted enzyme related to lactoylglutathione lyase|nr:VOC family protein [Solirubrobacterales bacterium]
MTTPLITGVDFVCVPTRDHDRAVAFYSGTLGLERTKRWGEMPGTEFQAGNLTLAVMDPSGFGQAEARPNSAPIALQVSDVEAARTLLEAKGVTFLVEMMDSGVCHQAIFTDPDGNPLILHHRYAPQPGAAAS